MTQNSSSRPQPLVSVIAPLYNEEKYLNEMLLSLSEQTYPAWEAILVDDGSTDMTSQIIEEWATHDSRFRIVSDGMKLGKVRAFNLAYENARGEIICHVGGDDRLPMTSLARRVASLKDARESAVLLGKLQIIDAVGHALGPAIPRGRKGSQSGPGASYTRRLCETIFPIPQELPSEDIWLGNAAVSCAEHVIHIMDIVVEYRVHDGNSNPRQKQFAEMSKSIHDRSEALRLLCEGPLPLKVSSRRKLAARWEAERLRYAGRTLGVLTTRGVGFIDRVALASMSKAPLWRLRQRLGVVATGWRGR